MKTVAVGKQRMKEHPIGLCIHVQKGWITIPKACLRDFECTHCAFDQWLDDTEPDRCHSGEMDTRRVAA